MTSEESDCGDIHDAIDQLAAYTVNVVARLLPDTERSDIEAAFWPVVAETIRRIRSGKEVRHLRAYLVHSVYHAVLKEEPQCVEVEYSEDTLGKTLMDPTTIDLCKGAHLKQVMEVVVGILTELPQDQARIFVMRAVEEESYVYIAEVFGIEINCVRQKFYRARMHILNDPRFKAVC